MGVYVYKVSTKPIGTLQGRPVYPSQFAYKPYWTDEASNRRMSFQSGCESLGAAWRRKADREGIEKILVTAGGSVMEIEAMGAYYDDYLPASAFVGKAPEVVVTDRRHLAAWIPKWDQFVQHELETRAVAV